MKLSQKILDRIKQENVTPKSRIHFIFYNGLLILAILFSIMIGSLAIAIVIRHFALTNWELAHQFSGSKIKAFFILLPYLWLIFILFAIYFADQLFRQTKGGHRQKPWVIILSSVVLSLNFGYILYLAKLDRPFENVLVTTVPFYENWEKEKNRLFAAPDRGVLAGEIVKINSKNEWILIDFADQKWLIYLEGAKVKNNFIPYEGTHVGVVGQALDKNHFQAEVITQWKKPIAIPSPFSPQ